MSCRPEPVKTLDEGAIAVGRAVHYVRHGRCLAATILSFTFEKESGPEPEPLVDLAIMGLKDKDGRYFQGAASMLAEAVPHSHTRDGLVDNTWHFPDRI